MTSGGGLSLTVDVDGMVSGRHQTTPTVAGARLYGLSMSTSVETGHPPSSEATVERAVRIANIEMLTVELQRRRLRSSEPEDGEFTFRWWADLQFLIIALWRLRRAVRIAQRIPKLGAAIRPAIEQFDRVLPGLKAMRDIGEHIDEYAVDATGRHRPENNRQMLEVGTRDGTTYTCLHERLNIEDAHSAAEALFAALLAARDSLRK